MAKMSDFWLSSFLRSDDAKIFVNLAEYAQGKCLLTYYVEFAYLLIVY